jgi:hypothetical protein
MKRACLVYITLAVAACSNQSGNDASNYQVPKAAPQGLLVDEAKRDPNGLIPLSELERVIARQPRQKGGLWEIIVEKRAGPNTQPATKAQTVCLTDEYLEAARKLNPSSLGACTVARLAWSGGTLSLRESCPSSTNQPVEMLTTTTATDEKTDTSLVAQKADGTAEFTRFRGTRVGDCLN